MKEIVEFNKLEIKNDYIFLMLKESRDCKEKMKGGIGWNLFFCVAFLADIIDNIIT